MYIPRIWDTSIEDTTQSTLSILPPLPAYIPQRRALCNAPIRLYEALGYLPA
jgi:hypothetical protein